MRRIILSAGILLCLLAFMPSVAAYDDSVRTLVFAGNPEDYSGYQVGDNVPVEVRFFDRGQPKDADTSPTVTVESYGSSSREIYVSRSGVGVYSGSFTISQSDVEDDGYISISADATLGREGPSDHDYDEDSDYEGIFVSGETGFDVRLVCDDTGYSYIMAEPGDTIKMTITATHNGNNVDPEEMEVLADDEPLTHTRTGKGLYTVTYVVSSSVAESRQIDIDIEASYNDDWAWASGTIIVDFYPVWYHELSVTGTMAQFELCAADMEGSVLSGARFEFNYEIDEHWVDEDSPSQTGTTDSGGKATFAIGHSGDSTIYIEGTLYFSGKTQHFRGDIALTGEGSGSGIEEPSEWDSFEVIYQENAQTIKAGESVTLEYIAYEYAIPVSNQAIYYYIHTSWDFIKSGSTSCDGSGRFSITFTVPDEAQGTIYADFESPFEKEDDWRHCDCDDNLVYLEDRDYIYTTTVDIFTDRDKSISISATSFEIGTTATISASRPNSNGFLAIAVVLVGELTLEDIDEDYRPKWEAWVGLSISLLVPRTVENNRITQTMVLPEFLPEDETYTILVLFVNPQGSGTDYHWNYIHLRPGGSESGGEEDLQDILFSSPVRIFGTGIPCLLILVIIIILLVVLFAASRPRKEETRPPAVNVVTVEPDPVGPPARTYSPYYAPQRDYHGTPYSRRDASKGSYPGQYTRRHLVSEVGYSPVSVPPDQPAYRSSRTPAPRRHESFETRFSQRSSSVMVSCQVCRNEFHIQGKTPPFRTKCPFCGKHNIVV